MKAIGPSNLLTLPIMETMIKQEQKRNKLFPQVDLQELRAVSRMAARLFGDGKDGWQKGKGYGGVVEFDAARPGIMLVGYFLDPPLRSEYSRDPMGRPRQRRTQVVLRGATHAELIVQARMLGIAGVL